jgi:hypothetical protein
MNMNPFELGMIAPDGLHGVMDKFIADKEQRVYQEKEWSYFYNPMWSRLGDESAGTTGTYYYPSGGVNNVYWHTFDQALIRPSLIPAYENGEIRVLDKIGSTSLLRGDRIDTSISDHLPLLVKLEA